MYGGPSKIEVSVSDAFAIRTVSSQTAEVSGAYEGFGPRLGNLLFKMPAAAELLEMDEVDILDSDLPNELI